MRQNWLLPFLLALSFFACDRSMSAGDYDQSCSIPEDCAAVPEGDVCSICPCSNTGINKKDYDRYIDDFYTLRDICIKENLFPAECVVCGIPHYSCDDGVCGVTFADLP